MLWGFGRNKWIYSPTKPDSGDTDKQKIEWLSPTDELKGTSAPTKTVCTAGLKCCGLTSKLRKFRSKQDATTHKKRFTLVLWYWFPMTSSPDCALRYRNVHFRLVCLVLWVYLFKTVTNEPTIFSCSEYEANKPNIYSSVWCLSKSVAMTAMNLCFPILAPCHKTMPHVTKKNYSSRLYVRRNALKVGGKIKNSILLMAE